MAYYTIAPLLCALVFLFSKGNALTESEIRMTLYVDQVVDGPNRNQIVVTRVGENIGFGTIAVIDWTITNGQQGPSAMVIGRLQGLQVDAGHINPSWYMSMVLTFDTGRFNGSTIQVMGPTPGDTGVWSIVGGTGKFTMARGVVQHKKIRENAEGNGNTQELNIHAYYTSSDLEPGNLFQATIWRPGSESLDLLPSPANFSRV
ncbi:hypothetical protein ACP4OV_019277 [Aristida adscensionis]